MFRRTRCLVALATVCVLARSGLAARPAPCPDGRFLLPAGAALLTQPAVGERAAVSLAGRSVTIEGACAPARAKVKPGRRGTRVAARWRTCGERRKVQLAGTIAAPACAVLRGAVKARQVPAVKFEAARSACGDGYADRAGGEVCDLPPDDGGGGGGTGSEPTPATLDAAHDALAAGATDVALSPDGTLRFRRSATATGGTEEVLRNGAVLVRWVHDGDLTTLAADAAGDGVVELQAEARRAPARSATVRYDLDGDGTVERTLAVVEVGADGVEVEITEAGQSPYGFSAPRLQAAARDLAAGRPAAAVVGEGCNATELSAAQGALGTATQSGFQCLRSLGLDAVAKTLAAKIARDGVVFRCNRGSDCAQADILDTLTEGFLPTAIGVNLGAAFFTGAGACSNASMVVFHELLHVAIGEAHSPFLDRTTFEGLATDKVYSCTDLCFRPGLATKGECATCLGVGRCDPKCAAYRDAPSDPPCTVRVDITQVSCPTTACSCCPLCPAGVTWVERVDGTAGGPVGSSLRVNMPATFGGTLTCGGWSQATCPGFAGDFAGSCCQRMAGDPEQTTFTGTLPVTVNRDCVCPAPAPSKQGDGLAQILDANGDALVEDTEPFTCPQ